MSDYIAQKLLNDRAHDGALLCPDCGKPIALNIGARFFGPYALHIACGRILQQLQDSEDRAREIMKHSAQLRDRADALVRESEAARSRRRSEAERRE